MTGSYTLGLCRPYATGKGTALIYAPLQGSGIGIGILARRPDRPDDSPASGNPYSTIQGLADTWRANPKTDGQPSRWIA